MKTIQVWTSTVCYDEYALEQKPELAEFLQNKNLTTLLSRVARKVVLVLGGDGTMLRAIRENHEQGIPFLWINFWSLGFLLNDKKWVSEWSHFIQRTYPLLEIRNNWKSLWVGFNDVNLYSPEWKLTSLQISLEWMWDLDLRWDGALIATPAGSTWHSKSYFWPVIPHINKAFIITPKWNSTPEAPKIIPNNTTIHIKNTWRRFDLGVNLDGVQVYKSESGEEVCLEIQKLQESVTLLIEKDHTENWDWKVMQQQWFKL